MTSGNLPAELLGQFDPHRLLALDAVGLAQGRAVEPADFLLALGDEPAAIVDQPVDEKHLRALHRDLAHVDRRRVVGAEHRGRHAGARAIGGHRRAGIAVGRHRHVRDAELLRHRHREREAARLERAGRQPALVLDDQLAAVAPAARRCAAAAPAASRPRRARARFPAGAPAAIRDSATGSAAARPAPRAARRGAPRRDRSAPAAAGRRATARAAGRPHSARRSCCIRDASQRSADRRRSIRCGTFHSFYLLPSGAVLRSSQYKAEPFVPTGGDATLNLLPLCKFIEPFDGEQTTVRGFAAIRSPGRS